MIEAVIFDMDGLLIDSEPFWEHAEMTTFAEIGVPLTMEKTKETIGLRVDEVVKHWFVRYPWEHPAQKEVEERIVRKVIEQVRAKGSSLRGVQSLVRQLVEAGIPMAIASSSQTEIIKAVLDKLEIGGFISVVHSAELEPYGKPHPGVYISTAERLGLPTEHCLAFEDSPNGVLAAKAARMKCVAVPGEKVKGDRFFSIADLVLPSLEEFSLEYLNLRE